MMIYSIHFDQGRLTVRNEAHTIAAWPVDGKCSDFMFDYSAYPPTAREVDELRKAASQIGSFVTFCLSMNPWTKLATIRA